MTQERVVYHVYIPRGRAKLTLGRFRTEAAAVAFIESVRRGRFRDADDIVIAVRHAPRPPTAARRGEGPALGGDAFTAAESAPPAEATLQGRVS